jgi:hypothetical protein
MFNRFTSVLMASVALVAFLGSVAKAGDATTGMNAPINPVTGRMDNRYEYRNNGPRAVTTETSTTTTVTSQPEGQTFPRVNPVTGRTDNRYEYRMQQGNM